MFKTQSTCRYMDSFYRHCVTLRAGVMHQVGEQRVKSVSVSLLLDSINLKIDMVNCCICTKLQPVRT